MDGSNPLGFFAALGLLRMVPRSKLAFATDGSFRAFLETDTTPSDIVALIASDAEAGAAAEHPSWRLTYTKPATKKQGPQGVADLKAPPPDFTKFLARCLDCWMNGDDEAVAYAAAFGTDVALDGKGNTKPTAFHFTAANQTFLGAVETIRAALDKGWIETSLFSGHGERPGSNLRWDPGSERNWALMANNPNDDGTRVDAPLEWLAFRGLPLLPSFPRGTRIITTAVFGRGDDMTFSWPLWSVFTSQLTARSVLQLDWTGSVRDRIGRGVFAVCSSSIRRTSQGFGNFGPPTVT
ncbi:MAG: hypothetical protein NDJ92_10140 [Thermoanaerobaculia bacterium]|nr:hypothetical protein [Thermoanaerobaculia bacterium]